MTDEDWMDATKGASPNEVAVDYLKAPDFRIVWADGAVGGITPNAIIHFALYAERLAIPRRQVFKIERVDQKIGQLGAEILEKQISRGSIVREMSCDVFISPKTAENLAAWLLARVAEIKKVREDAS